MATRIIDSRIREIADRYAESVNGLRYGFRISSNHDRTSWDCRNHRDDFRLPEGDRPIDGGQCIACDVECQQLEELRGMLPSEIASKPTRREDWAG